MTLPKDIFTRGEPIPFTLEMRNVSDAAVRFQVSRYPNSLHLRTDDGKEMPYMGPQDITPAVLVTLQPAETCSFVLVTRWDDSLLEGTYVAYFEEEEPGGGGFVAVRLKTPPVRFEIVKKETTP